MFPQQPQQQFRTAGADVQIFYGSGTAVNTNQRAWNKPAGVSHVYMMLIGGGGNGDGAGTGGGSGAVTVWYGAAQHVPNALVLAVGGPETASQIYWRDDIVGTPSFSDSLLIARSGNGVSGGAASTTSQYAQFAASGFFQSVAGQDGDSGSTPAPSTTTFLTGGAQRTVTANYGYTNNQNTADGFFQLQPIIVGVAASSTSATRKAGTGCGGAGFGTAQPGGGMILIASW
jgi:hypothetical protein